MEKEIIKLEKISKSFYITKRDSKAKNVIKTFLKRKKEEIVALKDVSFSINEGEIVGYIGPNGAGKSTTIKIMCGILNPTSGNCVINNQTPWKDRKKYVSQIGVVFGQRSQLWWDVPPIDSFELLKDIYKIPKDTYEQNLEYLTKQLDIEEIMKIPTRQLSLGQRMRCEIAASLLHNPKILFLDEPTIGLDAVSKLAVRNCIKKLNKDKKITVILTTHDMQDIEALTDRIILIGKGKLLYDGSFKEIKKKYSQLIKAADKNENETSTEAIVAKIYEEMEI